MPLVLQQGDIVKRFALKTVSPEKYFALHTLLCSQYRTANSPFKCRMNRMCLCLAGLQTGPNNRKTRALENKATNICRKALQSILTRWKRDYAQTSRLQMILNSNKQIEKLQSYIHLSATGIPCWRKKCTTVALPFISRDRKEPCSSTGFIPIPRLWPWIQKF